jgi:hypothetical protein
MPLWWFYPETLGPIEKEGSIMTKQNLATRMGLATLVLLLGVPLCLAAKPGNGGKPAEKIPGYRIKSTQCTVQIASDKSLLVTGATGAQSSLKIQYFKKLPSGLLFEDGISTSTPGEIYLTAGSVIPEVQIQGAFGQVFTQAPILSLETTGTIEKVFSSEASVNFIEARELGYVKMAAEADSSAGQYATTSIQTSGTTALKIQLTGVILENLVTSQSVTFLKADSKKYVNKGQQTLVPPAKPVSLAGIGRVTPTALADLTSSYTLTANGIASLQTKGASMTPDSILSTGNINKIQALEAKFSGSKTGGLVGRTPGDSVIPVVVSAPEMGMIYGQAGVHGVFNAGVDALGAPNHQGTIQKIATKPNSGALSGIAHVKAGSTIQLIPQDAPNFIICADDPANHPAAAPAGI